MWSKTPLKSYVLSKRYELNKNIIHSLLKHIYMNYDNSMCYRRIELNLNIKLRIAAKVCT